MDPDCEESHSNLANVTESKITCFYENGYGSSPFFMQVSSNLILKMGLFISRIYQLPAAN